MPRLALRSKNRKHYHTTIAVDHDVRQSITDAAEIAGIRAKHGPSPFKFLQALCARFNAEELANLVKD